MERSAWWYNWASLFLSDVNTGTWSSRLGESRVWISRIWLWVARDSDQCARASSSCKRQTRPLVRESAPHQQTRNCLTEIKIWSWASDDALTQDRLADWPFSQLRVAVARSEKLVAEVGDSSGTRGRGTSAVRSRYQATVSEDTEDFMCAIVTVIFGVFNSVRLS
jgi:hypothetical protein